MTMHSLHTKNDVDRLYGSRSEDYIKKAVGKTDYIPQKQHRQHRHQRRKISRKQKWEEKQRTKSHARETGLRKKKKNGKP